MARRVVGCRRKFDCGNEGLLCTLEALPCHCVTARRSCKVLAQPVFGRASRGLSLVYELVPWERALSDLAWASVTRPDWESSRGYQWVLSQVDEHESRELSSTKKAGLPE